MPAVPVTSLASSITSWPCSSAISFWIDASVPGVRPLSLAESVRSRLRRRTSALAWSWASFWRSTGSSVPPPSRTRSSSVAAEGPAPQSDPAELSETRSLASVTFARRQPSPSSPMRFSTGMRMSSKNTWLNECAVVMSMIGDIVRPGVSIGTAKYEMPLCFGASGFVRAIRIPMSEPCAPDDQIFDPLTTYSSPSRSARVARFARSEPASGSEKS